MNTKIALTYEGVSYTLEYNRMAIKVIENDGFELEKFATQPMTMIDLAFRGAFYKNHRKISQTTIDDIYTHCPDKDKLLKQITNMITECYQSLTEDPSDGKNVKWEVVSIPPKMETLE